MVNSHGELKNHQKSVNTGDNFEHQVVVTVKGSKDYQRILRNPPKTLKNLLFPDICR